MAGRPNPTEADRLGSHLFCVAAMAEVGARSPNDLGRKIARWPNEKIHGKHPVQLELENPERAARDWYRGRHVIPDEKIKTIAEVIARRTGQQKSMVLARLWTARAGGILLVLDPKDNAGELATMLASDHLSLTLPRPLDAAHALSSATAPANACFAAWLSCFMMTVEGIADVHGGAAGDGWEPERWASALHNASKYLDQVDLHIPADQLLDRLLQVTAADPSRAIQQRLLSDLIEARSASSAQTSQA